MLSKSVSCAIGEHYVLCELLRNEIEAYIANGPNQEGWDIVAVVNSRVLKIQVKTAQWNVNDTTVVNGKFDGNFDFLVIVLINFYNEKYATFVVSKNDLQLRANKYIKGLLSESKKVLYMNKTITLNALKDNQLRTKFCNEFKDKWEKLKE